MLRIAERVGNWFSKRFVGCKGFGTVRMTNALTTFRTTVEELRQASQEIGVQRTRIKNEMTRLQEKLDGMDADQVVLAREEENAIVVANRIAELIG